jgi:hypothetical protein
MSSNIFISIDVEADGPIPGMNNMLSFGAAAFNLNTAGDPRKPVATFQANLETLSESRGSDWPCNRPSEDTMAWWAKQPAAWEACRKDPQDPEGAMRAFVGWVRALRGSPVVIGYPVTYDFMFLYWYTMAFGGLADGERCPFGFQGFDLKTYAAVKMGVNFRQATKRRMPKHWFKGAPKHNHEALTDAIGQGVMFVNMVLDGKQAS